jgi:peroxiredoxin
LCNSELRSFEERRNDFEARGVRIAGISIDPPEVNRRHRGQVGVSFALLSDPQGAAIRRYDLLHPGAGPGGSDIARPAEFLIDAAGTVRWRNLTESFAVRLRPQDVLKAVDDLGLGGAPAPPEAIPAPGAEVPIGDSVDAAPPSASPSPELSAPPSHVPSPGGGDASGAPAPAPSPQ